MSVNDLHCDFETFTINKQTKKPSELKSFSYSFCVSFKVNKTIYLANFVNFFDFMDRLGNESLNINFHFTNGNKFDNHFIYSEFKMKKLDIHSLYNKKAIDLYNQKATKISEVNDDIKYAGTLFTTRVRSSSSLELKGYYRNIKFQTVDEFLKTGLSIKTIGYKLLKLGLIPKGLLKQELDYDKYDMKEDIIDYKIILDNSKYIFNNLTHSELIYIYNDVIIQHLGYVYYNMLFKGFDYNKRTLTSNILASFETEEEAVYQLERDNPLDKKDNRFHYSNYVYQKRNVYEIFRNFLNGGLNLYNKTGVVFEDCFSMDLNHSYPAVMYKNKIPVTLVSVISNKTVFFNPNNDYFSFYICDFEFINLCISKIKSNIIKKALVKYYNVKLDGYCYVNDNFFRVINLFSDLPVKKVKSKSIFTFKREYFAGRDEIASNYAIKTQGKNRYVVDCSDPLNIKETNIINKNIFNDEEIAHSKVKNNGLFGSPALRLHFNIFVDNDGNFENIKDGFTNKERNVIFSSYVTSEAFYNLLYPLSFVSDIDRDFVYCDTDSLYLSKRCFNEIPSALLNPLNLGSWDIEHSEIDKIYVLNHKKYCFEEKGKLYVHSGGVRQDNFKLDVDFNEFIKNQFSDGVIVSNTGSIINKIGSVSIYDRDTLLKSGCDYHIKHSRELINKKKEIMEMIKEQKKLADNDNNYLYVETEVGSFSGSDFIEYDFKASQPIDFLIKAEREMLKK